jgi:hypothetical protein
MKTGAAKFATFQGTRRCAARPCELAYRSERLFKSQRGVFRHRRTFPVHSIGISIRTFGPKRMAGRTSNREIVVQQAFQRDKAPARRLFKSKNFNQSHIGC